MALLRLRFEIVRGAQEPSQRRDMNMKYIHIYSGLRVRVNFRVNDRVKDTGSTIGSKIDSGSKIENFRVKDRKSGSKIGKSIFDP